MKKYILPVVLALTVIVFQTKRLTSGSVSVDISIALLLLFIISYYTQFPFSSASFGPSQPSEKLLFIPLISFLNLFSVFILPALLAYSFGFTLSNLLWLLLLCLVVFRIFNKNEKNSFLKYKSAPANREYFFLDMIFWVSIIVTLAIGVHYGCWLSGDYTWHGTYIRKLRELPAISFRNYLLMDLPYPQYGHNIWHLFLALLSYISNKDSALVWVNCNLFLPLIKVSSFYLLSREMFKSSYWGKISTVIFLVFFSFLGMGADAETPLFEHKWSWDTPYPSIVSREIFLIVFLFYIFKSINEKKYFYKEIFLLSLGIVLTHYYYMFQLVFILMSMLAASFFFKTEEIKFYQKVFFRYFLLLLPAICYTLVNKHLIDNVTVNPWFSSPEVIGDWRNRIVYIWGKYPIIHIWKGFLRDPFFAAGILSVMPIMFSLRNGKPAFWKLYLVGTIGGLSLIFFNPPLLYFLKKLNPGLDRIWRLAEVLPVTLTLTGFLYQIQENNKWVKKGTLNICLFSAIIFTMPVIVNYNKNIVYNSDMWTKTANEHIYYKNILEKYVPPGSNVFPDPQIAWTWTTIFPHYIYIHPFPAGLPSNFDPTERITLWKQFFSDKITQDMIEKIARSKITHIILTQTTYAKKEKEILPFSQYFERPIMVEGMGLIVIKMKG